MIGLILMQHGKGADMGAAFGSGARAVCSAQWQRQLPVAHHGVPGHGFLSARWMLAYFGNAASGQHVRAMVLALLTAAVAGCQRRRPGQIPAFRFPVPAPAAPAWFPRPLAQPKFRQINTAKFQIALRKGVFRVNSKSV